MATTLNQYIAHAIVENWDEWAFTEYHGQSTRYGEVAVMIEKAHILLEKAGIKPGDKVALCGKNGTNWAVAFLAAVTFKAVPVPLLHEFKPDNLHYLINHSDARLLIVDPSIWENLDPAAMDQLVGVFSTADMSLLLSRSDTLTQASKNLDGLFSEKYPQGFTADQVSYPDTKSGDLCVINYTSGSMGFSKGVMLPNRAIESNIKFCLDNVSFFVRKDHVISMLPLAHMFGLVIELLHPFARGCHIYFLTRIPSPKVILDALAAIKPKLIITVPLVVEKIIKKRVFPVLDKPLMRVLLHIPLVDRQVLKRIYDQLYQAFGGNLCELIVGGAAFNKDVNVFLHRIHFPITEGYGMTECGPLVCYTPWQQSPIGSCGRAVDRMQLRVESKDPEHTAGELWVKGDNVMLGYYKNEKATAAVMKDGWMNTGDLATIDRDGFVYLRGRSKNMILGPSGQNIYPEEIEQQVNNLPFVSESLVIEDANHKLIALIYPDMDSAKLAGITLQDLPKVLATSVVELNKQLPSYSQIANVRMQNEEFQKTPKRSIKRYLYQH